MLFLEGTIPGGHNGRVPQPQRLPSSDGRAVPPWRADLGRGSMCAAGIAVGCTLLLLLASTGLLHHAGSGDVIAADGTWAGILAGVGCVMWPFLQISFSRPGSGFRHHGLPGLLALGVFLATIVDVAVMSVWPWIVGDRAASNEVIATLVTNPLSLALVASFVLAMHAWTVTCVLGFVRGGWKSSLAVAVPFLVLLGAGIWQGSTTFANPPTGLALAVWSALAALGLVVLSGVAALVGPDRSTRS